MNHLEPWNPGSRPQLQAAAFPPLSEETREIIATNHAAHYLNRRPQTLRIWACNDTGPIRPVRIHGRLGWRTADIRRVLLVEPLVQGA